MPWDGYAEDSRQREDGDVFFHGRAHRAGCVEARGSLDGGRGQPPFYRRLPGQDGDWDHLLLAPTIDDIQGVRPPSVPGALWFALILSLVPRKIGGPPMKSPLFRLDPADLAAQNMHVRVYFVESVDSALAKLAQLLRPVAARTSFSQNVPHARLIAHQQVLPHHTVFSEPLLLVPGAAAAGQFTPPLDATSYATDHPQLPNIDYGCMAWSEARLDAARILDPGGYELLRIKAWPNTARSRDRLSVLLLSSRSGPRCGYATEWGAHVFVNWSMYGPAVPVAAPGGALITPEMTIHLCHDVACLQPQHLVHGTKRSNAGAQANATASAQALLDVRRRDHGVAHWTRLREAANARVQQWSAEAHARSQYFVHARVRFHQAVAVVPPPNLIHVQAHVAQQMHTEAVAAGAAWQDAVGHVHVLQQWVVAAQTNMDQLQ
jgi:hypothetical protein